MNQLVLLIIILLAILSLVRVVKPSPGSGPDCEVCESDASPNATTGTCLTFQSTEVQAKEYLLKLISFLVLECRHLQVKHPLGESIPGLLDRLSSTPTTIPKIKRNQSTLEKTVSAMFGNPDQGGRCRWLRGSRKQNRMCRRDAGVPETLQAARTLATTHCSEQFRYDRWNCSSTLGNTHFLHKGRVYRETAFLHAISAAAIAYSVSRACADGKLTRCKCAEEKDPQETRRTWRWGGCGDNVKFGRRFTRNFLQLRSVGQDTTAALLRYNSEVGIQVRLPRSGLTRYYRVGLDCW
uniref:Protein Wnt n=1 Tax=Timema californicum TaxID=61474 RepID=A0A7R9J4Q3_TIMCA|nr:unnamed protein product [Timema californicum]